jgi:hypothetical protein
VTARARASAMLAASLLACHDLSSFASGSGGYYEGPVVGAGFVKTGLGDSRMCLTVDTTQLQTAPGAISTNDGLFHRTPLRPIPQLWQDPLSTLTFGEGRIQNALYVARGAPQSDGAAGAEAGPTGPGGQGGDVFVVISFMVAGDIEVRLLRGAPPMAGDEDAGSGPPDLFGVFVLSRGTGTCPY